MLSVANVADMMPYDVATGDRGPGGWELNFGLWAAPAPDQFVAIPPLELPDHRLYKLVPLKTHRLLLGAK